MCRCASGSQHTHRTSLPAPTRQIQPSSRNLNNICREGGKHQVVRGAWRAVPGRYGEEAVVGEDVSVAIEEGDGCDAMRSVTLKKEVDLFGRHPRLALFH